MPVGPFASMDACLMDPRLNGAYPDAELRRRVCVSLEANSAQRSAAFKAGSGDAAPVGAEVVEGPTWWLVRGNTAAREGVNANRQLKPWQDLVTAAPTLEGVPFVWNHPADGPFVVDRLTSAGIAVNARAREDRTVGYDLLLFKEAPPGYKTTAEDLQRNALAVQLIGQGVPVHNSVGYAFMPDDTPGAWKQHDGTMREFAVIQREIRFDHVAGLAPIGNGPGACPVGDGCGLGIRPASDEAGACAHSGGCCKDRARAAVKAIQDASGCTELAALALIVGSRKGS